MAAGDLRPPRLLQYDPPRPAAPTEDPFAAGEGVRADPPAGHPAAPGHVGMPGATLVGRPIVEVVVVPELCLSFLNCMRIATGAFGRDRETGRTRPTRWEGVEPAKLWRAAWSCPSGAIRFVTEQGYVNPRWEEAAHWRSDSHPAAGHRRTDLTPVAPPKVSGSEAAPPLGRNTA